MKERERNGIAAIFFAECIYIKLAYGGVCPQIQGRQCGAYVGAVEEMMCVVCVDVTEGGIVVMDVFWRRLCVSMI